MQKRIDFENPLFKALLARNFKIDEKSLKHFVLPLVGDSITLGNVIYRITYVRENPYRFSAEPIGILTDEDFEKELQKAVQNPEGQKVQAEAVQRDTIQEVSKTDGQALPSVDKTKEQNV